MLTTTNAFTQMGHGMMRGGHMMGDQGMMGEQDIKDQFEKMLPQRRSEGEFSTEHRHMMNNIMGMTQDIALMMRQLSVMMANVTDMDSNKSRDKVGRMSGMMKNMSAEMNRISDILGKGTASRQEIRDIQNSMLDMQEKMVELKR
jgi:methyl-accepting chemotaxis protein